MFVFTSSTCGAPRPKGCVCPFAAGPIVIDGVMDERAWRAAPWTADFVDIEGDARPASRVRTRVKMLWETISASGRISWSRMCGRLSQIAGGKKETWFVTGNIRLWHD